MSLTVKRLRFMCTKVTIAEFYVHVTVHRNKFLSNKTN